jgi:DNA-binding MarR family transcriptional regulator
MAILDLENLAGFELRRAHAASTRKFTEIFADLKIKPGQFSILLAVSRFPDQSQAAIAKLLSLDPSSVVPLIDQLERKGYLKRVPKDRRSHALRITGEGAEKLAKGHEKVLEHERALLAGFDRKERDTFLRLLKRVRTNLDS